MNTGVIAERYAEALLKLVKETGSGGEVVSQVKVLGKALRTVPNLRRTLEDPAVSDSLKLSVFESALSPQAVSPDLKKFLTLVMKNKRTDYLLYIFISFEKLWYASERLLRGVLVVPEMNAEADLLEKQVKEIISSHTGKKLELEVLVKPDLIGGFVLEIGDNLLDASVRHQLDVIRRQFIERNRRIV